MKRAGPEEDATSKRRMQTIRAADLAAAAFHGLRVTTPGLSPNTPVLNGLAWSRDLLTGLRLHASATRCLQGFETQAGLAPGLICVLAFHGQGLTEADAGGHPVSFAPMPSREARPEGFVLSVASPCTIHRNSARGLQTRKVSIVLPAAWLDRMGTDEGGPIARFRRAHLAIRRWQPSPRLGEAASRLLKSQDDPGSILHSVAIETLALQIAEHALRSLTLWSAESLSERECADAARLQAIIEAHLTKPLPIGALAREAGMSMRRANAIFERANGQSITAYIRNRRMEKAKEGIERSNLTIAQIGYLAGFSSPANFATAFRRRFGVTPKQARGS